MWTARPRRLNLGDLMCVVAIAALGCGAMVMAWRDDPGDGRFTTFALATTLLLGAQAMQWRLGGRRPRLRGDLWLGIASYLLAMAAFLLLVATAALFPAGAALVVLAMIVAALHLSTWDRPPKR
jgi:peptidoglycan/LPS O-acetylase OafA/YrhL